MGRAYRAWIVGLTRATKMANVRTVTTTETYYNGPYDSNAKRSVVKTYPILSRDALLAIRQPPANYPASRDGAEPLDAYLPNPVDKKRYGGLTGGGQGSWDWLKWREFMLWGTGQADSAALGDSTGQSHALMTTREQTYFAIDEGRAGLVQNFTNSIVKSIGDAIAPIKAVTKVPFLLVTGDVKGAKAEITEDIREIKIQGGIVLKGASAFVAGGPIAGISVAAVGQFQTYTLPAISDNVGKDVAKQLAIGSNILPAVLTKNYAGAANSLAQQEVTALTPLPKSPVLYQGDAPPVSLGFTPYQNPDGTWVTGPTPTPVVTVSPSSKDMVAGFIFLLLAIGILASD